MIIVDLGSKTVGEEGGVWFKATKTQNYWTIFFDNCLSGSGSSYF